MVTYAEWISIASTHAKSKYGDPSFEEAQGNVSLFAEVWNNRKAELKAASRTEAAGIAAEAF